MATNKHSQITSKDEIHVPKGFTEADTSTIPFKTQEGTLEWVPYTPTLDFDEEIAARAAGDASLSTQITEEAQARIAGDQTNKALVEQEAAARIAGDQQSLSYVNQEATARIAGDEATVAYVDDRFTTSNRLVVSKSPKAGEFASIAAAAASITDSSATNPYLIVVAPGIYQEPEIVLPPHTSVRGDSIQAVMVEPSGQHDVFRINTGVEISFLSIRNAPNGKAAIRCTDCGDFAQLHKVSIYDSYIGIHHHSVNQDTTLYVEYVDINGSFYTGLEVHSVSGAKAHVNAENFYIFPCHGNTGQNVLVEGLGASLFMLTSGMTGTGCTGVLLTENAYCSITGTYFDGCGIAIHVDESAENAVLEAQGLDFKNCGMALQIDSPTAGGRYSGYVNPRQQRIHPESSFFITNKARQIITVGDKGCDFTSVAAAAASITDATEENPYLIVVSPGRYVEPEITVPPFVSVTGSAHLATVIESDGGDHHIFVTGTNCILSEMTIIGAAPGYAGIYSADIEDHVHFRGMEVEDCGTGIKIVGSSIDTMVHIDALILEGSTGVGIHVLSENGMMASLSMSNCWINSEGQTADCSILIEGSNAKMNATAGEITRETGHATTGTTPTVGIRVTDGAQAMVRSMEFTNLETGVVIDNSGSNSFADLVGLTFRNCVKNIDIQSPTASGTYTGHADYQKTFIHPDSTFFITEKDARVLTVSARGADFTSVKAAVESITNATAEEPWIVKVAPGTYVENVIHLKPYVTIQGVDAASTFIEAADPEDPVFWGSDNATVSRLTIFGSTSREAHGHAIHFSGKGTGALVVSEVAFGSAETLVHINSGSYDTFAKFIECRVADGATFDHGFEIESQTGKLAEIEVTNFNMHEEVSSSPNLCMFYVHGPGTALIAQNVFTEANDSEGEFLRAFDGAEIELHSVKAIEFGRGIYVPNLGAAPTIQAIDVDFHAVTGNHILIEHPGTTGTLSGSFEQDQVFLDPAAPLMMSYLDAENRLMSVTGDLYQGSRHDKLINLSDLTRQTSALGVVEGGALAKGTGPQILVSAGRGFLKAPDGFIKEVSWPDTTLTMELGTSRYIIVNENSLPALASSISTTGETEIVLGSAYARLPGVIHYLEQTPIHSAQLGNKVIQFLRQGIGSLYLRGSIVTENDATPRALNVTPGTRTYGINMLDTVGGSPVMWEEHYRLANGSYYHWASNQLQVRNDVYDPGTGGLEPLAPGKYAKHSFFITGEGINEKYGLVYSNAQYDTLLEAEGADIPLTPPEFRDSHTLIATIITQQGANNIIQIRDERPRMGFKASGVSAASDHGNLTGLDDPTDHQWAMTTDGSRSMSGTLNMGGNSIQNVNLVDGVDVSTHASRHAPNGADALPVAAPVAIGESNSAGIANSFPKSDHVHAHGPQTNPAHHAVATGTAHGFMSSSDKSKLDGVASGATANQTDSFLLSRANHTGTQTSSTISDFSTAADARITAQKAQPSGLASLDASTKLISSQHGSYTDPAHHALVSGTAHGFMASTDKTKLDGIADSATANQTDSYLLSRVNHTGTQAASTISDFASAADARITAQKGQASGLATLDTGSKLVSGQHGSYTDPAHHALASGTAHGFMSSGDKTKLDGVAAGATANQTDSFLLNRINHTGTQTAATISDFGTAADARITAQKAQPSGLASLDSNTKLVSGQHGSYTDQTHHAVASSTAHGFMSSADKTKLDGVATGATANQTDAYLLSRANHTGTQTSSTISDFSSAADARISAQKGTASGLATLDGSGKHPISETPTAAAVGLNAGSVNAEGTGTAVARNDHTHAIATGVASGITPDQASASGVSTNLSRADHVHNVPTAAASAISTSSTSAQGTASSFSRSDHVHAVSVTNLEATSTTAATTNSTTDTLLTGMTLTPAAGTWLVLFSTSTSNNNTAQSRNGTFSIYVGGTQITPSERTASNNALTTTVTPVAINDIISVTGSQAVEIRWRTSGGTQTANARTLNLIKLA